MSSDLVYYWTPQRTTLRGGLNKSNVMGDGRAYRDEDNCIDDEVTFTKWGVVFSYAEPHTDKSFRSNPYFDCYSMVHKGYLWRGRSWGGARTRNGITIRANRFADIVAADAEMLEGVKLPEPDSALVKRNAELTSALLGLIDLITAWMNGFMHKMGLSWEDDPPALKRARLLLELGGAIGTEEDQ